MIRSLLLLLAASTAIPALARSADAPPRLFQGSDLFGLEVATDPRISPDGAWIVYVRKSNDIMTDKALSTLWLIDARTGAQSPLVAGPGTHVSPRWSPDGKRLAYVSAPEGGAPELYVRWMASGATARITSLPDSPSAIAWAPDGSQLAYIMRVPGEPARYGEALPKPEGAKWADPLDIVSAVTYRQDGSGYVPAGYDHIFTVPADGGSPRQRTFGPYDDGGPLSWAPDGRTLYFSANRAKDWEREPLNTEVYALDLASDALTALTRRNGPDAAPIVSPDGRRIAYLGFDDKALGFQNNLLYVMDRDGGGARAVTAGLDRSIDDAQWAADSRSLYIRYDEHGSTRVARVTLDGKLHVVATGLTGEENDRPYSGGEFSVARSGTVAFTSGTPLRPSDISITQGSATRRLTRLNENLLAAKTLGQVRPLAVTAPDKRPIDAWLVTPPDFDPSRKYPLILEIHGGPYAAYGPAFSSDDQLYAAAGYVVLYANPRGSTSYGEAFANLIQHTYPGRDYDDLMAAVDAAIAQGFIDPDNLFVTGGSGGGVLTAWIVGKTGRFRAAATQKPVIDWASFALTADQTNYFARYWFGKFPWEDPQAYWARSPLSLVGNVTTPTMVVVGSEDYRTPVSEAEQYYTALQLRGVPTVLVKVPGASHGGLTARPSQAAAKASAILDWFGRYRQPPH